MVCFFSFDLSLCLSLYLYPAGFDLKNDLINYVKENFPQYETVDLGTNSKDSCDYPVFGHKVGKAVVEEKTQGILVCGTGIGISIAANKVPGVRCALCHDVTTARLCREVSFCFLPLVLSYYCYFFLSLSLSPILCFLLLLTSLILFYLYIYFFPNQNSLHFLIYLAQ